MCVDVCAPWFIATWARNGTLSKSGKQGNEEDLPTSVAGGREENKYYAHWRQRHFFSPGFAKSFFSGNRNIKIITIAIITATTTTSIWWGHARMSNRNFVSSSWFPQLIPDSIKTFGGGVHGGALLKTLLSKIHTFNLLWKSFNSTDLWSSRTNKEANKNHHFLISTSKFYLKCSSSSSLQMTLPQRGISKYYDSQGG